MNKPELLAPAGDMEKLKTALYFGADAVYLGGPGLHLRAASADFTLDDLQTGVEYAHGLGKRVYVTVNAFARNGDFETLPEYAQALSRMGVDAVLVADIGVLAAVKKRHPVFRFISVPRPTVPTMRQPTPITTWAPAGWC